MAAALNVVVVGGSAAGMFASLLLARAGHTVTVLEQDQLTIATDVEAAGQRAFRPSAPQIAQPHAILPRCRELLLQHLPDLYAQLLDAGICEAPLSSQLPPSLADREPQPGDERLVLLMTRRTTLDWVLQRAVLVEPRITMHCGTRVTSLVARSGEPPHVTGVRTSEAIIPADLVVDASGARSPVDHWLAEIGARPTATVRAECGIAYFSQYFRLRPHATPPGAPTTRMVAGLDEFTVGIWGGDNGVMQLAVAPLAKDHRFKTVRNPTVFTAVLRSIPFFAAWLDALQPITEIFIMGAVHNTLRRFVVEGSPVVTGLVGIGDSVCTTNPTLGRGLSLALYGAADLLEVLERDGSDDRAQALAMDAKVEQHILPFYLDQVAIDRARLAELEHRIFDGPCPPPVACVSDSVTFSQLRAAAMVDSVACRAFWRIMGMISRPDDVYTDPEVVTRTLCILDERKNSSAPAIAQPNREQLLAALATSVG